jgi:hypothetical protein
VDFCFQTTAALGSCLGAFNLSPLAVITALSRFGVPFSRHWLGSSTNGKLAGSIWRLISIV